MTVLNINEFRGNCPFEGLDKDDDFTPIETLRGKEIIIKGVYLFENQKGPGASVLYATDNGDRYFTTHALGIVAICAKMQDAGAFDNGNEIAAKVVYRKSQKSDNFVYALE